MANNPIKLSVHCKINNSPHFPNHVDANGNNDKTIQYNIYFFSKQKKPFHHAFHFQDITTRVKLEQRLYRTTYTLIS